MTARWRRPVAYLAAGSIAFAALTGITGGVAFAADSTAPPPAAVQLDAAPVPETPQTRDYCSGNINYYPAWGVYNRQGVTNYTNPTPMWFYQDGKVGPRPAASGGNWTTGGKGVTYCGNNFWYSASGKL